jgi:hypothetical protein
MDYKINIGGSILDPLTIKKIEKSHCAIYVSDLCIKTLSGSWSDTPLAIFYNENPPNPDYSNYFGVYYISLKKSFIITNGLSAVSSPITGIASSDGEVVYSRYGHDFRSLSNNEGSIDGGRNYLRVLGSPDGTFPSTVELQVQGPKLVVTKVLSESRNAYLREGDAC